MKPAILQFNPFLIYPPILKLSYIQLVCRRLHLKEIFFINSPESLYFLFIPSRGLLWGYVRVRMKRWFIKWGQVSWITKRSHKKTLDIFVMEH